MLAVSNVALAAQIPWRSRGRDVHEGLVRCDFCKSTISTPVDDSQRPVFSDDIVWGRTYGFVAIEDEIDSGA